jgi:hypothetical protein
MQYQAILVDINIQIQETFYNINHVQTIDACQGQSLALAAESEGLLDIKSGLHYTLYNKDANGFSTADRPATTWC